MIAKVRRFNGTWHCYVGGMDIPCGSRAAAYKALRMVKNSATSEA